MAPELFLSKSCRNGLRIPASLLFDGFVRCSQTMCGWLIRSEDKIRQPLALHTLAAQATLAGCSNPPELL